MSILNLSKHAVLLVEDDAFVRSTIKVVLRSFGHPDLREASDGEVALHVLAAGFKPTFILCDVQMQPMDGVSFVRRLRDSRNPFFSSMPVIMLAAGADKDTVSAIQSFGNCGYLLKPVSPKALSDRIELLFQRGGLNVRAPATA